MKFHDLLALKKLKNISCKINFESNLTQKDSKIIRRLLLNKRNYNKNEIILKESDFYKLVNDKRASPDSFMKRLTSKKVELTFYYKDSYFATLILPILIYGRVGEHFILTFTDKFLDLFDEKYIYPKLGLHHLFFMTLNNSKTLYLYLHKEFNDLDEVSIPLDEFKEILGIDHSYSRFYDFEKNILAPATKDMNLYLEEKISYKKVKSGKTIHKIIFSRDKSSEELGIQDLFDIIKDHCKDHYKALKTLEEASKDSSIKDIRRELYKLILDYDKSSKLPFDSYLETKLRFKKDTTNTIVIKKVFSSPSQIQSAIYKELEKINLTDYFNYDFFGFNFFRKIIKVKNTNKPIVFENDKMEISVNYQEIGESTISITLKENVVVVV